jgi:predicted DsbA family dithiol-disulfide isomerase
MAVTDSNRPTVTQFTDPMCTWCWGSEPVVQHLDAAYGDQIRLAYVMGGLIEDWDDFYDAANDIATPADVVPHWKEAVEVHGMLMDPTVLTEDPPDSTYPANIAFEAARLTDPERAHRYLRRLREDYATKAINVCRREAQVDIAADVGIDTDAFTAKLDDGRAREAFEADRERLHAAGVRSFPTYRLDGPAGTQSVAGFQSFDALADALERVAPGLERRPAPSVPEFVADYGPVATREVAEVCDLAPGKTRQVLGSLADEGTLRVEDRAGGQFWHADSELVSE